jgi:hypothetical protein
MQPAIQSLSSVNIAAVMAQKKSVQIGQELGGILNANESTKGLHMQSAKQEVDTGIVRIHNKNYQTVALRVGLFRKDFPDYSLITEIIHRSDQCVVMQAKIVDPAGRVIATGHAEEYRQSSTINKTSALENAETSAIGRALAGLGFGGTEFATADEVANAITGKPAAPVISPVKEALQGVVVDGGKATDIALALVDLYKQFSSPGGMDSDADYKAYELLEPMDSDMKLAVWQILQPHSKVRSWLKKIGEDRKKAA